MNKTRILLIAGLTVGAIALGGSALAARGGPDTARMVDRISSRLSLDDNQAAALQVFADTLQAARSNTQGGPRALILQHLGDDTLDQGAALEALEARADAMRAAAPEIVAAAAAFYDGLDAEQRAQVRTFLERRGKRGKRGEREDNN